ncbi:hypothetical protein A2U01_0090939, partial [Trifolium medium]|nr:hypothetical protein [Trifolium medium]
MGEQEQEQESKLEIKRKSLENIESE